MKNRIIFVLAAALCVSLFFNYWQYRSSLTTPPVSEVVTVVEYKDRTVPQPEAKVEKPIGEVRVPVRTVPAKADTAGVSNDSLQMVGDNVVIPLTQKVYGDSLYTAFVSGYHQQLDSINLRIPTVTKTITQTKVRRWNVGVVAGYGLGFNSRQLEPFVGVGVTYNLFK